MVNRLHETFCGLICDEMVDLMYKRPIEYIYRIRLATESFAASKVKNCILSFSNWSFIAEKLLLKNHSSFAMRQICCKNQEQLQLRRWPQSQPRTRP